MKTKTETYEAIAFIIIAIAVVALVVFYVIPAKADSTTNSIFSNIQNFTVKGNNNNFIITANHGTGNATNTTATSTKPLSNPLLKAGEQIKSLFNATTTTKTPPLVPPQQPKQPTTLPPTVTEKQQPPSPQLPRPSIPAAAIPLKNGTSRSVILPNNTIVALSQLPPDTNITVDKNGELRVLSSQLHNNNDTSRTESSATINQTSDNNTAQLGAVNTRPHIEQVALYDKAKNCALDQHNPTNVLTYLTHFSCGHVSVFPNGTTLRTFTLIVEENHMIPITLPPKPIMFPAWTFNASIPGPTMRMTEGDHVQITLINKGTMSHTLHMHSIHPSSMDGVPGLSGASGDIQPGHSFTYDFIAGPYGVYPYHCHANPITEHINRGLYGVLIIDPKTPRPAAHEMVMLLNGYHLNFTDPGPRMPTNDEANSLMNTPAASASTATFNGIIPSTTATGNDTAAVDLPSELDNDLYSVNGVAFYYYQHPIQLKVNQDQRIYLVNMLDFEENSYHMHGALFDYYPSGTSLKHSFTTDMITLGQGDRGILEFNYHYPGLYMQHAHFDQIASRGWMSVFEVS